MPNDLLRDKVLIFVELLCRLLYCKCPTNINHFSQKSKLKNIFFKDREKIIHS